MEESQKNTDDEPHKYSLKSESSHSSSIELNRSSSDYSATSGSCTDQISPTPDKRKESIIEILKKRELSYQALESSGDGKSGSSSSYYLSSSASSNQSLHTASMSSSPEHPILNPFVRPTKVAPLHKQYGSSSDGALSDNAKEASPKKKRWLQSSRINETSDMSGSSGESQDTYSHQHSTPGELSSREVTHLDPPDLGSTPAEVSFGCLQLSGECSKLASPCYSLPDPLSASPTEAPSSDAFGDVSRQLVTSKTESEQCAVEEKRYATDSLPKWVKVEREKRNDFDCTRSSDSTDSATKSSGSAASSQLCGSTSLDRQCGSGTQGNQNRHVPVSQDFLSANSQSIHTQETSTEEDIEESCVYPLPDYPKKVEFKGTNSMGITEQTEEGLGKKIGDSSELDVSSPCVLQPSQSSVLSVDGRVLQMKMSSLSHGNLPDKSDHQSQDEEKSLGFGLSPVLDESPVAQEQPIETSASGEKVIGLQKNEEGGLSLAESHLTVKDTDAEMPQKDFSPEDTTLEKDMELEMSQDLFNGKLDQSGTAETDLYSAPKEPTLEDGNHDFSLFLSQTQENLSQKFGFQATRKTPAHSASSDSISKYAEAPSIPLGSVEPKGEELLSARRQNSIDNTMATPSQSILPKDDKTEPSFTIITSVATDLDSCQTKGLDIPKDILNKVSSNELSLSGCVHISPPPDGGSFRPTKTLTPPLRNAELNVESSQEEKHDTLNEKKPDYPDEECVDAPHTAVSLLSKTAAAAPVEGREMEKVLDSEALSDNPKITGFPSDNLTAVSSNSLPAQQGAKIPSKSTKVSMNVLKRNLPASAAEIDPFAFNEDEDKDGPQVKKRNTALKSSQKLLPRPVLPEEKSESSTETFCKVVTEILVVKELTVTRKIVVKVHSMEGFEGDIYHQSEYSEGLPVRTVTKECCGSSIEVVPLSSLSLKQQVKDKKTPKRQTPTRSCRKSPGIGHKRRRSSSSTPPEGYTGVPKRLRRAKKPVEEDKHGGLECKRPFASTADGGDSKTKMQTRSNKSGDLGGTSVHVGMPVLGKWLDNCYYPGKTIEKTGLGRYKVRFHDEKELMLGENAIVPQHTLQQGQTVCARNKEDGFYYQGTICRINRTKDGAHSSYHIKLDDSGATENVNVSEIMLDIKQMAQGRSQAHSASKNNSNVHTHSHTQGASSTTEPRVADTETAESQERQKQAVKCKRRLSEMRQRREESTLLMISSSSPEVDSLQLRVHPRRRKNDLSLGQQASSTNAKKVLCTVRKVKDPSERVKERWERIEHLKNDPNCEEELRLFGSLPEDSTLFKGYTFLVTFIRSKSKVEEDIAFILKNFKRSHISCQITAGGGTILDSVKNLQDVSKKKLVLIAPICQKTLKYYFALCYGIPCVSHFWVIDSCKENRLLPFDEYFLKAGIDQVTGALVYAHNRTQPLRGFKIYVAALPEDRDELSLAVKFSGAELVSELPEVKKFRTGDVNFVLVGDNIVLKRSLISHSRKLHVLCVTLKWFFQCIIHGEFVNPQSSDLFIAVTGSSV